MLGDEERENAWGKKVKNKEAQWKKIDAWRKGKELSNNIFLEWE